MMGMMMMPMFEFGRQQKFWRRERFLKRQAVWPDAGFKKMPKCFQKLPK